MSDLDISSAATPARRFIPIASPNNIGIFASEYFTQLSIKAFMELKEASCSFPDFSLIPDVQAALASADFLLSSTILLRSSSGPVASDPSPSSEPKAQEEKLGCSCS